MPIAPVQELFVYYKVAEGDVAAVRDQVAARQAALCAAHPGLRARLLRRPETSAGLATLMELYARDASASQPGGVDAALRRAIDEAASGLAPWLRSPRHTEVFQACA